MQKRILSVILVLCLMVSLSVSAFAAELTPSADKTSVEAGSDVKVTLTLSEDIPNVTTIYYMLRYNGDLYALKSGAAGATAGVVVSEPMSDKTGSFVRISYLDSTSEGVTMKKGVFASLVFTAKTSVTETTDSSFELIFRNGEDKDGNAITHTAGAAAKVTVTPAGEELTLYGRIYGSSVNSAFADLTGDGNGVEYVCKDVEKKNGLDVIKGVLEANGYTYTATATAITSVTDPNGVTLANGDETYGPKSSWVATINGVSLADCGVTSLAGYVVDNESTGFDGDEFVITFAECSSESGKHNFVNDVCTVCGKSKAVKAEYTVAMGDDVSAKAGETVSIPVTAGYSTDAVSAFHAADMQFSYDTAKLEFVSVSDTTNYIVNTNTAGVVRVQAYGESKALGEMFKLTFKALDGTGADGTLVTVTSAKIDQADHAVGADAPEAKLVKNSTKITIAAAHTVTLPDIFEGEKTVADGEDYTFSKTDKDESHYEYSNVKATVDGTDVDVIDNGDGTYTVKNVTGDLTVTGTRTAKQYKVTVTGNAAGDIGFANKATYGKDYSVDFNNMDWTKYDYTLSMTIGGKAYTPECDDTFDDSYTYTVKGDAITGDIVITATKTAKTPAETTQVIFTGSGVNDVQGGNPQTAATGKDFTFEINAEAGYAYTVTVGGETIAAGADGKYTIPGAKVVSGSITVTVEKTISSQNVNVQKYVNLDGTSIWLVTVEGSAGDGKVFTYGGEKMFKTAKYGTNGTYAYLVVAQTLTKDEAAAQIGTAAGEAAGTVSYSGDVNGSGLVDINDAQLVYDMYNAHYANFDKVTMYKFLCADVSDSTPDGATLLNVNDAVAVVGLIK